MFENELKVLYEELKRESSLDKFIGNKDSLHPKIWENDDSMNPIVRKLLLKIAQKFIDYVGLKDSFKPEDITMTGSLANYNWTSFSDIDLHIVVDFKTVDENVELVKEMFDAKKGLWNEDNNIKIFGFDVELYVQDSNEPHMSTGIYSIENNDWIRKPIKQMVVIDKPNIIKKLKELNQKINKLDSVSDLSLKSNTIKKLKDSIKKMRQSGLEKGGEYSVENLVFKILRNNGGLDKLSKMDHEITDKQLSLK
jgi:hypothetical protein